MSPNDKQYTSVSTSTFSTGSTRRSSPIWPWLWEIIGVVVSILCIGAIAATLASIDGHEYRPWALFSTDITPNTLISIFAALSKASLLPAVAAGLGQLKWLHFQSPQTLLDMQRFDDASRGPVGAISLLWATRFRNFLASFGAILVVLSLTSDPFVQQILTYSTVTETAFNETARISAAQVLQTPYKSLGIDTDVIDIISTEMSAAIAQGISGSIDPANYTCPSGNCDWPEFTTLGICSTCNDISNLTLLTCYDPDDSCKMSTCAKNGTCSTADCSVATCVYTSPTGKNMAVDWFVNLGNTLGTNTTFSMHIAADPFLDYNMTAFDTKRKSRSLSDALMETQRAFNMSSGVFANFTTFSFQTVYSLPSSYGNIWNDNNTLTGGSKAAVLARAVFPTVSLCNLNLCLRNVTPAVENGHYSDNLSAQSPVTLGCNLFDDEDYNEPGTRHCPIYPTDEVPDTIPNPSDLTWPPPADSRAFYVDKWYMATLQNAIVDGFDVATRPYLSSLLWFQNNGSLPATFGLVADSMSNEMRADVNATLLRGRSSQPVTYVRVRWGWLVLPAMLAVGAAVFLVLAVVVAAGQSAPVWKVSSLALLFHGLGGVTAARVEECGNTEMARSAAGMKTQLGRDQHGKLRLMATDEVGFGDEDVDKDEHDEESA